MNAIKNKLRSRAGASMILAMVFMLFCSFVGGTVLASATANAQRVAQLAEQQDFLLERSAALLVSDTLQLEDGQYIRLSVSDSENLIREVVVGNGGVVTPTGHETETRTISFQVVTNVPLTQFTSMHRLMLETTVYRYLREYAPDYDELKFVNFPFSIDSMDDFLFLYSMPGAESTDYDIEGALQVTAAVQGSSGVIIPDYTANFTSGRADSLFDFIVDFGDSSQVRMNLDAYYGVSNPISVHTPASEVDSAHKTEYAPTTGVAEIDSVITQFTICWEDPLIEKGGA